MELEAVIARLQPIIDSTSLGIEWGKGNCCVCYTQAGPTRTIQSRRQTDPADPGTWNWNIGSGGAVAVDPGIGPAVEAAIAISQATPRRHAAMLRTARWPTSAGGGQAMSVFSFFAVFSFFSFFIFSFLSFVASLPRMGLGLGSGTSVSTSPCSTSSAPFLDRPRPSSSSQKSVTWSR